MLTKPQILAMLNELPDSFETDDIIDKILLLDLEEMRKKYPLAKIDGIKYERTLNDEQDGSTIKDISALEAFQERQRLAIADQKPLTVEEMRASIERHHEKIKVNKEDKKTGPTTWENLPDEVKKMLDDSNNS